MKKWITKQVKKLHNYRIFHTESMIRQSPYRDVEGEFYRLKSPDWVTIIPVIENEKGEECFILVKQYRHGSDSITLEFPAGLVDPGEDAETTVLRELREETGYIATSVKKVGEVNPNPAFMNNRCSTYVVRGLERVGEQSLDEHEEIEVVIKPIKEYDSMIGGNMVNSAIIIQAYYFYLRSLSPDVFNLR